MSCLACEASVELKKNGIEAECVIQFCKTYKDEPSFSTVRPKNSFKKEKKKVPRKAGCFESYTLKGKSEENKQFMCRNEWCILGKGFAAKIIRDAHEEACLKNHKNDELNKDLPDWMKD